MEAVDQGIKCRLFEEKDTEAILGLWERESGWGAITWQQFTNWFINTPYGQCLIVVAVDEDDRVKGQLVFTPSRMLVDGKEIKTLRGSSPILDASLRRQNLRSTEHAAFALMRAGLALAAGLGYQYVYSFPAHGWLPMFARLVTTMPYRSETAVYDCFALPLKAVDKTLCNTSAYTTTFFHRFDAEHERLWAETVEAYPVRCALHRSAVWVNWTTGEHLRIETRCTENGNLIGYAVVRKDGLLIDLVARYPHELRLVLHGTLGFLHTGSESAAPFRELKGMLTKEAEAALVDLPFAKDSYRFAFGGCLLDSSLDFESFTTAQWYMMPLG